MLKVGDILTFRLYSYGEKKPSPNFSDELFYICSHYDLDGKQYYTLIELNDGRSGWERFDNLQDLENRINEYEMEVINIQAMKDLVGLLY